MVEAAPSCALLGGFAIGARVALLWQHSANPSYKLASIPRYDDIHVVRTAGWAGSARAAGRRRGAPPKPRAAYGSRRAGDRPPTGAFSTLMRQSGLRASTGGVLATKSERKMLASTCLYSLCACRLASVLITMTIGTAFWKIVGDKLTGGGFVAVLHDNTY